MKLPPHQHLSVRCLRQAKRASPSHRRQTAKNWVLTFSKKQIN
ncbi:hypothetical protein HMPREF1545_02115 [Oscillibacter sp. KLE 1728]|nr:hypothetical protein HMPREF1545_02115 [Oscillibacter sp. KLE 1728]